MGKMEGMWNNLLINLRIREPEPATFVQELMTFFENNVEATLILCMILLILLPAAIVGAVAAQKTRKVSVPGSPKPYKVHVEGTHFFGDLFNDVKKSPETNSKPKQRVRRSARLRKDE